MFYPMIDSTIDCLAVNEVKIDCRTSIALVGSEGDKITDSCVNQQ
jgi:hypothetical protein